MEVQQAETQAQKEPRASTSDPEARSNGKKRWPTGGLSASLIMFSSRPAENGIVWRFPARRLARPRPRPEPMATKRSEAAYQRRAKVYLVDGGYLSSEDIEAACEGGTGHVLPAAESQMGSRPLRHDWMTNPLSRMAARMASD